MEIVNKVKEANYLVIAIGFLLFFLPPFYVLSSYTYENLERLYESKIKKQPIVYYKTRNQIFLNKQIQETKKWIRLIDTGLTGEYNVYVEGKKIGTGYIDKKGYLITKNQEPRKLDFFYNNKKIQIEGSLINIEYEENNNPQIQPTDIIPYNKDRVKKIIKNNKEKKILSVTGELNRRGDFTVLTENSSYERNEQSLKTMVEFVVDGVIVYNEDKLRHKFIRDIKIKELLNPKEIKEYKYIEIRKNKDVKEVKSNEYYKVVIEQIRKIKEIKEMNEVSDIISFYKDLERYKELVILKNLNNYIDQVSIINTTKKLQKIILDKIKKNENLINAIGKYYGVHKVKVILPKVLDSIKDVLRKSEVRSYIVDLKKGKDIYSLYLNVYFNEENYKYNSFGLLIDKARLVKKVEDKKDIRQKEIIKVIEDVITSTNILKLKNIYKGIKVKEDLELFKKLLLNLKSPKIISNTKTYDFETGITTYKIRINDSRTFNDFNFEVQDKETLVETKGANGKVQSEEYIYNIEKIEVKGF